MAFRVLKKARTSMTLPSFWFEKLDAKRLRFPDGTVESWAAAFRRWYPFLPDPSSVLKK